LIPQLAFRIPGVTKHLSGLFNNIDKILEEITRALQTQNAVAQQSAPLGGAIAQMQPAIGAGPEAGMPNLPQMGPNLGL
jgi:starvation-inducible outer membrane lipoprotein